MSSATNDDARAILHTLASQPTHTEPVAVVVERVPVEEWGGPVDLLTIRCDGAGIAVTTDEAAALVTALLADGEVHNAWLHGRGGK